MQREQHALLALHHHIALLLDHVIDIVRIELSLFEQVFDGLGPHVGGAECFAFQDVAGLDADTRHDPLVGGIHHATQFVVGKDVIRQVCPDTLDCGSDFSYTWIYAWLKQ